ncbi:MAG TPA: prolyl-tRNA synthetase associated domain-containing protein [Vicinamibacterales bacterium]|nr:prolyl-tRNA synthetase associated domain-containing protein [Vicinamibacterales bacterium]
MSVTSSSDFQGKPMTGHAHSAEGPVYARLEALGIPYARYEHPPIASAEEGERHWAGIDAVHCKNLFMRNQKGTRHYLVIIHYRKRANLRAVADQIGDGKLSFGSAERLMAHLGVTPGSVSPFGLIHDATHSVRVAIDRDLRSAPAISFHPNINTATVVIAYAHFQRFLEGCGNPVQYVRVESPAASIDAEPTVE